MPGFEDLQHTMAALTPDATPGLAWAVSHHGQVFEGVAGVNSVETQQPVEIDSIFRIASLTKPVVAVAVLQAVEDGALGLGDRVDRWLPELEGRRVLVDPFGPLDDTLPADRPITVRDLLTFTSGYGYDFANFERQSQVAEMARLELGVGPPQPATTPPPDEWMRRLASVPLDHQPGTAWRYHFGSDIAGVLLARVGAQPLDQLLDGRVFGPLGMVDTAFHLTPEQRRRCTTAYVFEPDGARTVFDAPDGQWASPPAFPSGGGGLLSTVSDMLAFGQALLTGGGAVLPPFAVAAMTTDHMAPLGISIAADDDLGWGFGVDVVRPGGTDGRSPGSYGWTGGLGSLWWNDPAHDLVAVLMTNQALNGPYGTPYIDAFRASVYAALG